MARKAKEQALKPNANPDEVAACFTEYSSMLADIARLQQKVAAMFGRYEKLGVDSKAIKNAYSVAQKDPNEARREQERNAEYLAMLEIVEYGDDGQGGFKFGLSVTVPKAGPAAIAGIQGARAYNDGYNSGKAGGKIDACKFAVGTEEFVRWRDGWTDGHEDRLAKNPDADKVTKAAPRKRGRRNGAEAPPPVSEEMGEAAGHA
jgi:ribosome modulation factor